MNTKAAVPMLLVLAGLTLTHEVEIANSADPLARDPGPRQTPPDAGRPLDGLKIFSGATINRRASNCASTDSGTCTAIWSPSKSALYAVQTSG